MDSVIAKLDNSVFGMLVDQPPHIMICGIKTPAELDFVNRVRPDFVCFDSGSADLRKDLSPTIRVLGSPDDLPVISGVDDARALYADPDISPEELKKNIRQQRPDTVVVQLSLHSDEELATVRDLIRTARSSHDAPVD